MLEQITPVLLTYNEEENIGRTLGQLGWASDVVVVDSYSTDNTVAIARSRIQVRLFQRTFDTHAQQWNFAVQNSAIKTEWILRRLDADYLLTSEYIGEHAVDDLNTRSTDFSAVPCKNCSPGRRGRPKVLSVRGSRSELLGSALRTADNDREYDLATKRGAPIRTCKQMARIIS